MLQLAGARLSEAETWRIQPEAWSEFRVPDAVTQLVGPAVRRACLSCVVVGCQPAQQANLPKRLRVRKRDGHGVAIDELALVPVRVGEGDVAGGVEARDLFGGEFQPSAPRFCLSCSSLRAPRITLETVGRCSSQLSAICGTDFRFPSRSHRSHQSLCKRARSEPADRTAVLCRRLSSCSFEPRRIFPVSRPQPSGLHTTAPTP